MYFLALAMALKIELKVASPLLRISTVLFRERRALLLFRSNVINGFTASMSSFFNNSAFLIRCFWSSLMYCNHLKSPKPFMENILIFR